MRRVCGPAMEKRPPSPSRFYSFGPFCLDNSRLLLLNSDGHRVPLAPRFTRALSLLVQNHGVDLTKEYLMDQLWPDTAVEENNLTVIISALRKALGEDPEQHCYIVTIPGQGYRFVAEVEATAEQPTRVLWRVPEAQATLPPEKESPYRVLQKFETFRKHGVWVSAAIIILAAALPGLWTVKGWMTARANTVHALAVLPFESEGFGSDDEYLALGMADALVARLHNIRRILVRPIGDVLAYRNSAYDPRNAGRTLGVSALVIGVVRKSGDRINVKVKLIRVSDAAVLWSEEFNGGIKDILAIQDRVADRVAYAVTLSPRKEERQDVARRNTKNPEAYQFYLHGQYFLTHRSRSDAQYDLNRAVGYFQQAVEKDQTFALAYAGLATAYNRLSWYLPAEDSFAKGEAAAQRALALDPSLAEAYRSLATIKQAYEWDFTGADAAYRRSIELDPEDAMTHRAYAEELLAVGRNQEAENEWHKAQQLDPFSTLYDTLGQVYFYSRRYREAFFELQGKQETYPDAFWYLAWIYSFHQGELAGTAAQQISPPSMGVNQLADCEAAYAHAAIGNNNDVDSCLKSLQKGATAPISPYKIALLYVALRDKDSAFYWLDRARQAHTWDLSYVKVDPRIDDLRADARFDALLQSMGLRQ